MDYQRPMDRPIDYPMDQQRPMDRPLDPPKEHPMDHQRPMDRIILWRITDVKMMMTSTQDPGDAHMVYIMEVPTERPTDRPIDYPMDHHNQHHHDQRSWIPGSAVPPWII